MNVSACTDPDVPLVSNEPPLHLLDPSSLPFSTSSHVSQQESKNDSKTK